MWDEPEYIDDDYDDDLKEDVIVYNTDDKEIAEAADKVIMSAKQTQTSSTHLPS